MIFCFGGKEGRLSGKALPGGVDRLYLTRDAGKIGKTTLQNLLGNTERNRFPASADMLFCKLCQHDVSQKNVDTCQGRLKPVIKIKSTALEWKNWLGRWKNRIPTTQNGKKTDFVEPNGRRVLVSTHREASESRTEREDGELRVYYSKMGAFRLYEHVWRWITVIVSVWHLGLLDEIM